ncbi:MAG TPA: RNA polymerase sigma factor [Ktedonobacterales bacterium]|nr:RNA polymerase sigma factor [Ktedonobacterales bacterium]
MAIARPVRPPGHDHWWARGTQPIRWALQIICGSRLGQASPIGQLRAAPPQQTLRATRASASPREDDNAAADDAQPDATQPDRSLRPAGATQSGRQNERAVHTRQTQQIEQFEAFFRRYERDVFGYVWRLTGDEQTAYDLSQEVFLRAWRAFARVQGYEQPRAWLLRVASNLVINHRQRASLAASHSATIERMDDLGDGAADIGARLATRDAVRATLLAIPARQRVVLVLRVVYGYGFDQIATTLGMTLAAAKMTLSRAREHFRQHYLQHHLPDE